MSRARAALGPAGTWLATFRREGTQRLEVSAGPGSAHSVANDSDCTVLFDGRLYSRRKWQNDFSLPEASDAALVLEAYRRWGEGILDRIKAVFALIVWDPGRDLLLCARDPHGLHPFFYAEDGGDLFLSTSTDALAQHPQIASRVDRLAIADHLCHRWPRLHSTYFERVQRLPGGYAMRVRGGSRTVARYWDPIPPGRPIDYLSEAETSQFGDLFEQAVSRCLPGGPAAIYLSGGLDSVSVAAAAQEELAGQNVKEPLLALSLVFEHPEADEEDLQRAVATRLGLPQVIVPVSKAVGPNGLLADALEMCATRSAPMMNLWNPAYAFLARKAISQGCEVILTGNGGDEWLEANVHHGRLALQRLDFVTFYRLWVAMQRSYPLSRTQVTRNLVWSFGLRPILRQGAAATLERTAPAVLARQERWRFTQTTPPWIAPELGLRDQMLVSYQANKRTDRRGALDNPMVAYDLEEFYESGKQAGIPLRHPFWDADLTAFLARVPPRFLISDGYSKGLVRRTLAERFPQLGFERSRKVTASGFYRSLMIREGVEAWSRMGGAQALAELGIVDAPALNRYVNELFRAGDAVVSGTDPGKAWQIWYLLTTEAWVRPRLATLAR
jgi:asparagine synthase (glutamine-hydrolysing)